MYSAFQRDPPRLQLHFHGYVGITRRPRLALRDHKIWTMQRRLGCRALLLLLYVNQHTREIGFPRDVAYIELFQLSWSILRITVSWTVSFVIIEFGKRRSGTLCNPVELATDTVRADHHWRHVLMSSLSMSPWPRLDRRVT